MRAARVAIGAGLTCACVAGLPGLSAANADTQVTTYSPFDAAGHVAVGVAGSRKNGECTGSSKVPRADAWRCFTKKRLYDPCYRSPVRRRLVVCVDGPWRGAIKLKVERFRKHGPLYGDLPWALITAGGSRCLLITGASVTTGYGRLNFVCDVGALNLFGSPTTQQATWTIWGGSDPQGADAQPVSISAAWY